MPADTPANMHIRHGGFVLEIPADWSDQSTLVFVGPLPAKLSTTTQMAPVSEAVAISFVRAARGEPQEILRTQAQQLAHSDPTFELLSSGPFSCGLGEGWRYTQKVTVDGQAVVQLAVACRAGDVMVLATGAVDANSFSRREAQLAEILRSMHLDATP